MRETIKEYCEREGLHHILDEWDYEKNAPFTPYDFGPSSTKKVWWKCEKGHEWQAIIEDRVKKGNRCPYCAGKKAIPGENDLATVRSDIAAEWHPTKNGALTPDQCLPLSNKKVWWRCSKGHEWEAIIGSRVSKGSGCPYCAGKKAIPGENDLATVRPDIAAEWHPTRNGDLSPSMVLPYSGKKVWWLCPKGHAYATSIINRTKINSGCPYCAGQKVLPGFNDLATKYPELAKQWHPTLNGDLTPDQVTPGSNKKVWWMCDEGHVWQAVINNRARKGRGCPICSGRTKRRN